MPKHIFKKYMPNPDTVKSHKSLQFLGEKLHDPNLWHLNRHSVAIAFAVGLFFAWVPTPTQMAMAAVAAFYFRGNLPISVGLVWITNPITMPPFFYFAYRVGLKILHMPDPETDLSLDSMVSGLESLLSSDVLVPFLTGCLILAITCSCIGYFGIRAFWTCHTRRKWTKRKAKRKAAGFPSS